MSDAIREAGLPPCCKAHGLRKAAARRLAEAGCSAHEIMAVTGHKTLGEVERYTRAAEQERLNAAAMAKQLENKKLANSPGQVGKRLEAKQKKSRVALPRGLEPPSYGVEIRPPLVATIQRLPQRTIDSIFPTPGIESPCLAFHTPFGPSKTAVPPLT